MKIIKLTLFFITITTFINNVQAASDFMFIDRMIISNNTTKMNKPKSNEWYLYDKDKDIFYYVKLGIINPNKPLYKIKYVCSSIRGDLILQKELAIPINEFSQYQFKKNSIKLYELNFHLSPQPTYLAQGQLKSLKDNNSYVVRLYIDDKLIGSSQFKYEKW